jgi:hypothetical protein
MNAVHVASVRKKTLRRRKVWLVPGSQERPCNGCGATVVISPSTLNDPLIAGLPLAAWCEVCWDTKMPLHGKPVIAVVPRGSDDELARMKEHNV